MADWYEACRPLPQVYVKQDFRAFFDSGHFQGYEDFLEQSGSVFKREPHVRVELLDLAAGERRQSFVLKVYYYGRGNIFTWWPSKSFREYQNLEECRKQGVPVVSPVAFGARRSVWRTLDSWFLITAHVEGVLSLRRYLRGNQQWRQGKDPRLQEIFQELGRVFRTLHAQGFFVYSSSTRNILVRDLQANTAPGPQVILLDMPYAGYVLGTSRALRARDKDLGTLLKLPLRFEASGLLEAFFQGYLPDPLGCTPPELRRRIARGVAAQDNRTFWSRWERSLGRQLRKIRRGCG